MVAIASWHTGTCTETSPTSFDNSNTQYSQTYTIECRSEPEYSFFDNYNECKEGWNNPRKLRLNSRLINKKVMNTVRNSLPRKIRYD